ncbi:inositol-tetrakisphosphate 1-kinase-like isoform X1 [Haemaphysalis longicornis]
MCNMEAPRPRIGFWWGDKKSRELSTDDFKQACSSHGLELVKLDLSRPLEEQGPLAAIVHKFCDILVRADHGDTECQRITEEFERYCRAHPAVVVVDPLENVRKVLNRYHQYRLVEQSPLATTDWVFVPPFVELGGTDPAADRAAVRERGLRFPVVCKPLVSHGMKRAHQMCLVFGDRGLADLQRLGGPCVAQEFVAHGGRLLKVYVLNQRYHLTWRPSLRDFQAADTPTVFFNSQDVSKPHSSSPLNADAAVEASSRGHRDLRLERRGNTMPCPRKLRFIVDTMRKQLGQRLFGIDIIVEKDTGRLCIIDVNNFPGYDGVTNFLDQLSSLLAELVGSELPDSGIDTSDSSDETPRRLPHH